MKNIDINNTDAVAAALYTQYCEAVGGKAFNGDALPSWEEFAADPAKEKQAHAWVLVAMTAATIATQTNKTEGLTFGEALEYAKSGKAIARAGWNGKGMCVYINPGSEPTVADCAGTPTIEGIPEHLFDLGPEGSVRRLPNLNMKAASGSIVTGWLASQTDLLAEDWEVVAP